jgi:glyoxylase-like metal-dependent hydrolase (beta-lactamase superfamily II)
MQAHEELVRVRPDRGAPLAAWLEYYQRSVELYERIARVDPGHDGEALYWAERERRRVDRIAAQLGKEGSR